VYSGNAGTVHSRLTRTDTFGAIDLRFIEEEADAIMKSSPVCYVKNAELCGSLFNPADVSGAVSCVNTRFFVDHTEPQEALSWVRENMNWPLGELLEGHEFLVIFEVRRRTRSRSRPQGTP
jgi:hypothetical protein